MFTSKRLVTVSLQASRGYLRIAHHAVPLTSSIKLASIVSRGYAAPRRGASSRPVQVKDRPAEGKSDAEITTHQQTTGYVQGEEEQQTTPPYYGTQASQLVSQSTSLQAFLKRSMVTTGLGIGGAALACAGFMQLPIVLMHPYIALGAGFVFGIGSLMGIMFNRPTYVQEGEVIRAVNSPTRQALFGTFIVAEGLALAPMLKMVALTAPMAIPVAASLALGTMAGMVAYALKQPQGSLARWGPALYVGLVGLICASLVNMFIGSPVAAYALSAVSIGIFSAFTAYDTQVAIDGHNRGEPDHLLTAANFFLNFINLFLDYLRLIRSYFE